MPSVETWARKSLALLLSAATVAAAPGTAGVAFAYDGVVEEPASQPGPAAAPKPAENSPVPPGFLRQLTDEGFLTGADDPIIKHLVYAENGKLYFTQFGSFFADYEGLKSGAPVPDPRLVSKSSLSAEDFSRLDTGVRQALSDYRAANTADDLDARKEALSKLFDKFSKAGIDAGALDQYESADMRMQSVFDGAVREVTDQAVDKAISDEANAARAKAAADAGPGKLTPVAAAGKVFFYDQHHQIYAVTDMNGKVLRSRDVQNEQEAFNRENIAGAPHLNESGVYDVDTLKIPYYEFQQQLSLLKRSFHVDRTIALAEILGKDKSYTADQYDPDNQQKEAHGGKTLEEQLETEYASKVLTLKAGDLLDPLFKKRAEYDHLAAMAMDALGAAADAARGREITQATLDAINAKRLEAQRLFYLAALYGELYQVKHNKDRMSGEDMRAALLQAPGSSQQMKEQQALLDQISKRSDDVAAEFQTVIMQLEGLSLDLPPGDPRLETLSRRLDALRQSIPVVEEDMKAVGKQAMVLSTVNNAYTLSDKASRVTWHADAPGWGWHTLAHPVGQIFGGYSRALGVQSKDAAARWISPSGSIAQQSAVATVGTAVLEDSYGRLSNGNFDGAYKRLLDLDPEAWKTCWSPPAFGGETEPTEDEKIGCAVSAYMQVLDKKAKWDAVAGMAGQLAVSAVTFSAVSGMAAGMLVRVGEGMQGYGEALAGRGGWLAWSAGNGARIAGQVVAQSGSLLLKLNATEAAPSWLARNGAILRAFNAWKLQTAVTAQLAGISGVLSAVRAETDPHTPFQNGWEAFKTGAQGGAQWAADNPWMMYVGVPGNVFGKGNWFARTFSNYGESGIVGGTLKTALGEDYVQTFGSWLNKGGAIGRMASFSLTTTDAVGKFWAGSEVAGAVVTPVAYEVDRLWNPDPGAPPGQEGLTEAQIQAARARLVTAERQGELAMNWGWLLFPASPAENAAAIGEARLSRQGYQVYQGNDELHLLVGKSGQDMPLNAQPVTGFMESAFGNGGEQSVADKTDFRVTEDMDRRATRATLESLAGNDLSELFRISRLESGQSFGKLLPKSEWKDPNTPEYAWKLEASDNTNAQAQQLLEQKALADPTGTRALIKTADDPALKEQLQRIYLNGYPLADPDAGLFQRAKLAAANKTRFILNIEAGTQGVLGMLKGLARGLSPVSEATRDSDAIVDDALSDPALASLLKTEREVDAKGKAFVVAVRKQGKLSDAFQKRVEDLLRRTNDWRQAAEKGGETPPYTKIASDWNADAQADPALTEGQKKVAATLADYVSSLQGRFDAAEIRNLKGDRIPSFRPKQQQVLTHFLSRFALSGAQGAESSGLLKRFQGKGDIGTEVVRQYLLLSTGGGKTLLAFEGLLPVAKADAALKGKKLAYMTANANLVTQARADYMAFGRLLTPLEIITMDELSTRFARSRLLGGERPSDYYLMGDELDKIAEDPVKTVGRESATLARENEAFRGLLANVDKTETAAELAITSERPDLGTYAARLKRFLLGDWAGEVSSKEQGARARADLVELKAERDQLFGEAERLHQDEVEQLEQAVALKKKELDAVAPQRKRLDDAKAALEKAAASGAGEDALKPLRDKVQSAGDDLFAAQDAAKDKIYSAGAEESPFDLDSLEQALAGLRDRRAAAEAKLAQLRADSDAMFALAERHSGETALSPDDAKKRDVWTQQLAAVPRDARAALDAAAAGNADKVSALWKRYGAELPADLRGRIADGSLTPEDMRDLVGPFSDRQAALLEKAGDAPGSPYRLGGEEEALQLQAIPQNMADIAGTAYVGRADLQEKIAQAGSDAAALEDAGQDASAAIARGQQLRADAAAMKADANKSLDALLARHEDLLPQAVGTDPIAQLKALSRDYRDGLSQAVSPVNGMYAVFQDFDRRVGRLMDSPAREGNRERREWVAQLRATGQDMLVEVQKAAAKKDAKPEAVREAAKPFLDQFDALLSKAQEPAAAAKAPPKPSAPIPSAAEAAAGKPAPAAEAAAAPAAPIEGAQGPLTVSSYQLRDAAEVAQLKEYLVKTVEAAATGDSKAASAFAKQYDETLPRAVWATDWVAETNTQLDGLSKAFARRMIDALYGIDPALDARPARRKALLAYKRFMGEGELTSAQRNDLYYQLASSESTGQGWARAELVNLMRGRLEDPAHVRYDRDSGKVFSVHVGSWMERMDTPTRRYWELQYGADLTMPFKHETESTARDVLNNPELNIIGLSGTVQHPLGLGKRSLSGKAMNFDISGEETARQSAELREHSTASMMFQSAADLVRENMKSGESLTFIGFKNTRDLKAFRELLRKGGVGDDAVASIFSDTEFLRTRRPKADVRKQMNLDGMKTGKVKVVLMDMLVGGRGLDLDFKSYGAIRDAQGKITGYEDGKGYKNVDMVIMNPETMSPGHYVQFQGRVSPDRVLPGARRRYFDFLDMDAALKDPKLQELARKEGKTLDAAFIADHLEAAQTARQRELLENSRSVRPGQLTGYGLMDQVLADPDVQKLAKDRNKAGKGELDARFVAQDPDAVVAILATRLDKELAEAEAGAKLDKTELLREVYDIPDLRRAAKDKGADFDADFIAANKDLARQALRRQLLDDAEALQRSPRWATGLGDLEN